MRNETTGAARESAATMPEITGPIQQGGTSARTPGEPGQALGGSKETPGESAPPPSRSGQESGESTRPPGQSSQAPREVVRPPGKPAPSPADALRPVSGATALPWEELVRTALLGTDRRASPVPGHSGGSAPGALLAAAAVRTVRYRAGLRPATPAAPFPAPAKPDARPPLPRAARNRLAQLLAVRAAGGGDRRGAAPDLTELLPQWLATALQQGYAPPHDLLPALLDAARARTDLRPAALAFAGPRALWLAQHNPAWRFALRGVPGGAAGQPSPEDAEGVARLWEEGLFAERVTLLGALREREPDRARELLATTWRTERAEDRLLFLDSLRAGLSEADEPFLDESLADRSRNVRSAAAELLSSLPGSALGARMAERAASCVSLALTGAPRIAVEAPHECDAGMERDGVTAKPPANRGERSWWFGQLVEATPLATWGGRLGGRTPEEVVALPVEEGWQSELHGAWCRAAVRQQDAAWSRALLGAPGSPVADGPGAVSLAERARLLGALPADERADWVAGFISAHGLSESFQLLATCPAPWAGSLGRAVVDALTSARRAGGYPWSYSGIMGLAERCLDPAEAPRLATLTQAGPPAPDTPANSTTAYWADAFERLAGTLRLREAMHTELTQPPA
ncbi:DUF5691 domain-containing protein [Streptomyces sp. NPDC058373]|uniref:DUF5691 domain-containing protein n=1 Tax=Streptomyces sp. NPDC058373 TaxID=3346465 RepID=UPI00365E447D